jgi:uncharacterized protein
MSPQVALAAVAVGFVSGVLSGMFGVGGGIIMTPGFQFTAGVTPIVALATPLPVILPTASVGAYTYGRAKQIDLHAVAWMVGPGIVGAIGGAALTGVIDPYLLLVATAALLAYQASGMLRTRPAGRRVPSLRTQPLVFGAIGLAAGFLSGLLGIGGGLVIVPLLANRMGMPIKTVLGTSLLTMVALVIPGTIVHARLGHIDWAVALAAMIGSVPGARVGAKTALGTKERTLRLLVGAVLMALSIVYGITQLWHLFKG